MNLKKPTNFATFNLILDKLKIFFHKVFKIPQLNIKNINFNVLVLKFLKL